MLGALATNCSAGDQRLQRPVLSFIRTRARYVWPGRAPFTGMLIWMLKAVISAEVHTLVIS